MPTEEVKKEVVLDLPEWRFGEREPGLLSDPVSFMMAIPLRQGLSWQRQVMPAINHYKEEFPRESSWQFFTCTFDGVSEGFTLWPEAAVELWDKRYSRSAQTLFNLMCYVLDQAEQLEAVAGDDWALLRRTLILRPAEDVVPSIKGVGLDSWGFAAYYLTENPPEENVDELLNLYAEVEGLECFPCWPNSQLAGLKLNKAATLNLARRLWLKLLYDGTLLERGTL